MLQKKIDIAMQFVDFHRYGLNAWSPKYQFPSMSDEDALLEIYYNLVGGDYGNTESNLLGELTVEIDSHDSISGKPILFDFPDLSSDEEAVEYLIENDCECGISVVTGKWSDEVFDCSGCNCREEAL
tara:strand:+ start:310 stop:690 length:381 start_codon:yes stop_codon:yes gene_type:complete